MTVHCLVEVKKVSQSSNTSSRLVLDSAFERYLSAFPYEQIVIDRCRKLLWTEEDCFLRHCMPGHFTASAWVVSPDCSSVLLVEHPKLGRLLQPGGHADGECDLLNVALREVQEETGEQVRVLSEDPLDIDIHFIPSRGEEPSHYHFDLRFLCEARPTVANPVSPEGLHVAWRSSEQVCAGTYGKDLVRIHQKAISFLHEREQSATTLRQAANS